MTIQRRLSRRHKRFMKYNAARVVDNILLGDKGWFWHAVKRKDGAIVVRGGLITWFGTKLDTQDSGETASGINTRTDPNILGCALPIPLPGLTATEGSPLPRIPWNTLVTFVTIDGASITVPLIDVGPSRYTQHQGDLTPAAFVALGGNLDHGLLAADYMILPWK